MIAHDSWRLVDSLGMNAVLITAIICYTVYRIRKDR